MAAPFLLVKHAVRYKGVGEAITTRAYPLRAGSLAEILEGDPIAVEEDAVEDAPAAALRYADVPEAVAAASARAIERSVRDRLPDRLTVSVAFDPFTGSTSRPASRSAFAVRVGAGGSKVGKLREKLDKKRRDLAAREEEMAGRKTEKWAAVGSAVLSNVFGRSRSLSGAASVLSKNRMENAAEARVAGLKAEIAVARGAAPDLHRRGPARFEPRVGLPPART